MRRFAVLLTFVLLAATCGAGEFYLRAIDGTGKLGPFRAKAGAKLWIDGEEHLLLAKKRNLIEGAQTEFAIKNPATKETYGPYIYEQDTHVTIQSSMYTIFISPLTDWETRVSRQVVMWTWAIEGGTRTKRYGEQRDRVYIVISARLAKEKGEKARSGFYVKSEFKNLLNQLFASNPNEEEMSDMLAESRIDGRGSEPFLAAAVPQKDDSWCVWAFMAAETNSYDFLHFNEETYPLPPTFSTDDSISIGEEIWKIVPGRHAREYINPEEKGLSIPPPETETDFTPAEPREPEFIDGDADPREVRARQADERARADAEARRRQAAEDRRKLKRKKLQKYTEPTEEDIEDQKASILSGETGLKKWKIEKKEDREDDPRMPKVW